MPHLSYTTYTYGSYTVFARVYHHAISELCKGLYGFLFTSTMGSNTSHHVLRFTGFDHRRKRRCLEYAFLTNAAATVRSVGAMSERACVRPRPSYRRVVHDGGADLP